MKMLVIKFHSNLKYKERIKVLEDIEAIMVERFSDKVEMAAFADLDKIVADAINQAYENGRQSVIAGSN